MRSLLLRISLIVGAAVLGSASISQTQVYMVAHQDDWPLFMGHQAWDDMTSNRPSVFIYTTAGDAGMKDGGWGTIPYFKAREEAAMSSLRLPASQIEQWFPGETTKSVRINSRYITVVTHRNTVSYFLRLPDGAPDGNGFSGTSYRSLQKFKAGSFSNFKAVDSSATYGKWSDLVNTVKAILQRHGSGMTVNVHDYDTIYNPNSHSDHLTTGLLAKEASVGLASRLRLWVDYDSSNYEENLLGEQKLDKYAMYGAYISTLSKYTYNFGYDYGHKAWLGRGYFREILP